MSRMAMREFTDGDGVYWRVWSTVPDMRGVVNGMQSGWLTFESSQARRRLIPIPPDWEDATLAELRAFCRQAELARGTPSTGTARVEDAEP
jgi:hypothetical protein